MQCGEILDPLRRVLEHRSASGGPAFLAIAPAYIPCFEVGGDFYDFLQISENRIVVTIADMIGKGAPAAIMMSSFRTAVRAYVDTGGRWQT